MSRYELVENNGYGSRTVYHSDDMEEIAEFIRQKTGHEVEAIEGFDVGLGGFDEDGGLF